MQTGQKFDQSYKGDDMLKDVELIKRKLAYSYLDGDSVVFMDEEDYSQYSLNMENLEQERFFLTEGLTGIIGLIIYYQIIGIDLPQSVEMTIFETAPAIKSATATGRNKPAEFATGLSIQVPEYLEVGEAIKINTQDMKFMSRA